MDVNGIITLINSVGFPIVVCGALMYYISKSNQKLTESIMEMTLTLSKLSERLDFLFSKIKEEEEDDLK